MEQNDIRKHIEDFIEMELRSCSMGYCTPEYIARSLQLPLEEVKETLEQS